jgi:eukaryotic-like serine/threonine-protein kinase
MDVIGVRLEDGDQVLREIGRGALARVYLVSDGERVSALKLLPLGHEGRVRHEFAIASTLDHRHLNRVDAIVEVAGRLGLLMPLVAGRRLAARGRGERARAAYLDAFAGMLDGLGELHRRGIVHRDVKPENVLVDAAGVSRVIDFDLAVRSDGRGTHPGLVGTAAYLSPEQARGERAVPASDLYAAGVMLYAALTGEVPFTGTVEEVVTAHRDASPPPPSSFDPTLAALDRFTLRLLAKDPGGRFGDGDEAVAALRRLRGGAPGDRAAAAGRMTP